MNFKKMLAGLITTAVAAVSFAIPAAAADSCVANVFFADKDWIGQYWSVGDSTNTIPTSCVTTCNVNGDGTYTIGIDVSDGFVNSGATYTDLVGVASFGFTIVGGSNTWAGIEVAVNSVKVDGSAVSLSKDAVAVSESGKDTRVDLYNTFSTPKVDAISGASIGTFKTLEISFTVSGTGADASEVTDAPATTTAAPATTTASGNAGGEQSPETGIEGFAGIVAILTIASGAAVVLRKKED